MMGHSSVIPREAQARPYELWRPVIRPERRRVFEALHRALATEWSRVLRDHLGRPGAIEFEGIGFESFERLASSAPEDTQVMVLAIEGAQTNGLLAITPDFARYLVDARLRVGDGASSTERRASFSRIEMALFRELAAVMAQKIEAAYLDAGIGQVRLVRFGDQMHDALPFVPEDYLMVFRFRTGEAAEFFKISLAFKAEIINCIRESAPAARRASPKVAALAAEVPLEVEVVLGNWDVRVSELLALGPDDSIVLPSGEDAWLLAEGVRVGRVRVEFDGKHIVVERAERRNADG